MKPKQINSYNEYSLCNPTKNNKSNLDYSYRREVKMHYAEYAIPIEIKPSMFPYFLKTPEKQSLTQNSPRTPAKNSIKQKNKNKFVLKLPNKAFKMKNLVFNQSITLSSSVLTKIAQPLKEKHFTAVKKTVSLEKFRKEGEMNEAIQRVLRQEETHKKDSSFSRMHLHSLSPGFSIKKSARRYTSPNKTKIKKDLFEKQGLNSSHFSMKSSLVWEFPGHMKKNESKDKDKAFLDYYLNSFDDSPEIRMKNSRFSRLSSPMIMQKSANKNKEGASPVYNKDGNINDLNLKLNKVEIISIDKEKEKNFASETEYKKRNDHNFMKILLHYWKFENKVPKNRPPPPTKTIMWNRKINFGNVRRSLLELLTFLSKINLNLSEFKGQKIFPEKAYEIEGSYIFLKSVKYGNYESVKKMLEQNKHYVLEYDYMEQTGLFWAAIKGHEKIAIILLEKGAYIDHLDKSDRNPLYYAIRNGNFSIANLLLYHQASPWSTKQFDLKSLTTNDLMLSLLKRSRQINMCLKFCPPRLKQMVWLKEREKIRNFFPMHEI